LSWLTVIWSMVAAFSLTFALLHLFFWAKEIKPRANLSFAAAAFAASVITIMELMAMKTASPEQMAALLRWVHLPVLVLSVGIIYFVRGYLASGRWWLAVTAIGLRCLALILSLTTGQSLFFKKVLGLKRITVLDGETVSLPLGSLNPWYFVGPLSVLALAAFVLDGAFTLWRRGTDSDRRRAVLFSATIFFFLITAVGHTWLVNSGAIDSPYIAGFSFVPILLAMFYELSCDMLHSVQLTDQLRLSEAELRNNKQRMKLAARAADLRLWEWDIVRDRIWSTDGIRSLYGLLPYQEIGLDHFLNMLYEEDRERVRGEIARALANNGHYESEYRIRIPEGRLHWFNSRGRVEFGENHQPLRMLGVTINITRRKQAELEAQQLRHEMTHLSRALLLGELSGSLAHELNQPLTSILSNAQAAQRFLARDPADLAEVRNVLTDIVEEDRRAAEIIRRLRALLKKGEAQRSAIDLNKTVHDVLKLVHSDLVNHTTTVHLALDPTLPSVLADRIQIQQVLLNLVMNACEAMIQTDVKERWLLIATTWNNADKIHVSVADQGPGIPAEDRKTVFTPFFTTKANGMGLGLSICRTLIAAQGGTIWATQNLPHGTVFHFTLPIFPEKKA